MGINRYIVGCKCLRLRKRKKPIKELIGTEWDVNNTTIHET